MATDNTTKLQNYIKHMVGSAEEARELISKMVLIDWSVIYPMKQDTVKSTEPTEKIYAVSSLIAIADTHQAVESSVELEKPIVSNVVPVKDEINMLVWGGGPIATTSSSLLQEAGPSTLKPMRMKPRRKQLKEQESPKPKYWEIKQRQLEAKEARLAKSARVKELQAMPYAEYLKTDEWQKTRRRALASSGMKCQMCSVNASDRLLNVHHNTYERLGYERPSDLIALCVDCHSRHHDKLPKEY